MSGCFRAVLNHLVLLPLNAASPAQICFRAVSNHLVLLRRASPPGPARGFRTVPNHLVFLPVPRACERSQSFRAVPNHLVLLRFLGESDYSYSFRAVLNHLVLLLLLTHRRAPSVYVLHFFVFLIWRFHAEAVSLPLGSTGASLHKPRPLPLRITCGLIASQEALLNGSTMAPQDIATWLYIVPFK